jgi:molybdopterin converting factor subunit 1
MSAINVRVKFFARVRDAVGEREKRYSVPSGTDVATMIDKLKRDYPEVAGIIGCSLVALNEEYASGSNILREGDTIAIIPAVSGG